MKEDDEKRCFKYPFMAAEILSCENKKIIDIFFSPLDEANDTANTSKSSKENKEIINESNNMLTKENIQKKFPILEQLLSILDESEINPVLAGYFFKVFEVLIAKNQYNLLLYIFNFNEHLEKLYKHSYNDYIAEILKKIVSNENI